MEPVSPSHGPRLRMLLIKGRRLSQMLNQPLDRPQQGDLPKVTGRLRHPQPDVEPRAGIHRRIRQFHPGQLDFGPWEQIFYGEFDGRRPKRVLVKVIGE